MVYHRFFILLYLPAISNFTLDGSPVELSFLKTEFSINSLQYENQLIKFNHLFLVAAIGTLGLWYMRGRIASKLYSNSFSGYVVFYMMIVLFGTICLQQMALFCMPTEFNGEKFDVLNRFLAAQLSDIIFFPLIFSAILVAFLYAFNSSFPTFKFINSTLTYYIILAVLYIIIFITSFLSGQPISDFGKSALLLFLMVAAIPAFAGLVICTLYLKLTPVMVSTKHPRFTYLWHAGIVSLLISFAFNMTRQPRGLISEWIVDVVPFLQTTKPNTIEAVREKLTEILFSFGIAIPIVLVVVGVIALLLWWLLAISEKNNTPHDSDAELNVIDEIMQRENQTPVHNHMMSVTRLVPEQFRRRITLPLALKVMLTAMQKGRVRPGDLGSVSTVHYARWIHLPRTNNYIFASNYDGSFESYLEDFITKLGAPLNGAWSHCVGYPKVSNIFNEGAEDGDRFIRWARGSMRPTPFWYSAYDDLSVEQIRRNALIRDGLARIKSASDAEAWLDLFNSVTRPEHALQTDQIQSLVFGGSKKLGFGCCLVIKNNTASEDGMANGAFQTWLTAIKSDITYGEIAPHNHATYLALSADGLRSAGFGQDLNPNIKWTGSEELDGEPKAVKFSSAFVLGMNNSTRTKMLGDEGDSAIKNWTWGKVKDPTQAVLLLHASTKGALNELLKEHQILLTGLRYHKIDFVEPDPKKNPGGLAKEPFGFVDGISNPIIRGTVRAARNPNSIHLAKPGEFVLGYKDNRGFFPPSPQIETTRDAGNILPAIPRSQPQKYPWFQEDGHDELRDLGRNGTYLVIRQLEQNVKGFHEASMIKAEEVYPQEFQARDDDVLGSNHFEKRKKNAALTIEAKLMGRWHDGRPLVSDPVKTIQNADGSLQLLNSGKSYNLSDFDNEFLYGRDDPQGHACPYGSHIRRSFPRDSLNPDAEEELDISNRHRLLRRGRAYTETDENGVVKTGTFFMCLNANIQRQFEFVQQTWVGSTTFHGLSNEIDPIAGQNARRDQGYTMQTPGRDQTITNLQSFITMKGGGYFFMPSRDALLFISTYNKYRD